MKHIGPTGELVTARRLSWKFLRLQVNEIANRSGQKISSDNSVAAVKTFFEEVERHWSDEGVENCFRKKYALQLITHILSERINELDKNFRKRLSRSRTSNLKTINNTRGGKKRSLFYVHGLLDYVVNGIKSDLNKAGHKPSSVLSKKVAAELCVDLLASLNCFKISRAPKHTKIETLLKSYRDWDHNQMLGFKRLNRPINSALPLKRRKDGTIELLVQIDDPNSKHILPMGNYSGH